MSLGETIYRLRTEKNLSQGDLADLLNVSRQSVSKWENNSAVPDLDKIVKLSEIFDVSLDELVKGKKETEQKAESERSTGSSLPERENNATMKMQVVSAPSSAQKTTGVVLLCTSFVIFLLFLALGGGVSGIIFGLPFAVCGVICLVCKKNAGLWCAWAVCIMVLAFAQFAMGLTWGTIWSTPIWTAQMNYGRLAISWVLFFYLLIMTCVTVIRTRKIPITINAKTKYSIIAGWSATVVVYVIMVVLPMTEAYQSLFYLFDSPGFGYTLISGVLDWTKTGLFVVTLARTVRYFRCKTDWKGNRRTWTIVGLVALCVVPLLIQISRSVQLAKQVSSAGIIGGADGPTAVFLAGSFGGIGFVGLLLLIVLVIFAGMILYKVKKK